MDFLIVLEARRPRLARKTCIGCTGWGCSSWRCQLNSHMSFPLSMVGWGMEMARDGEGGLPGVSSYHLNTNPVDWGPTIITLCEVTSVLSDSLQPHELQPARFLCLWNFPGKNTAEYISYSKGSSQPRDQTHISYLSSIVRQILYHKHHLGNPL